MNSEFTKMFNEFFNSVVVPYATTCDLISQKTTLNLVKQVLENTNSKEDAIKFIDTLSKCYDE